MRFTFPLEALYSPYLLFALGSAFREFSYRFHQLWMTSGTDEEISVQTQDQRLEIVGNGVVQLDRGLENLAWYRDGSPHTNINGIRGAIEECRAVATELWSSGTRTHYLADTNLHQTIAEEAAPSILEYEHFLSMAGFPIYEVQRFVICRREFSNKLILQDKMLFELGSRLSGAFHSWQFDDDYPFRCRVGVHDSRFVNDINLCLEVIAQNAGPIIPMRGFSTVGACDMSFEEAVHQFYVTIGKVLRRNAMALGLLPLAG